MMIAAVVCLLVPAGVGAQEEEPAAPEVEEPVAPEEEPAAPDVEEAAPEPQGASGLRLHVIDTRNRYATIRVDVYDVATRTVAATGTTTDEGAGQAPLVLELPPGLYKIVRAGESFSTTTDFATVTVTEGAVTDFVIVVDASSGWFRGAGVVTQELPRGVTIAGVQVSLSGGGSLMLNQQADVVGQTSGTTLLVGVFGNFGLVFDRGSHHVDVGADLELNLLDQPSSSVFATTDVLSAQALYAYNINNPYVGPYARVSGRTAVFPSYLYLESDTDTITVTKVRVDGTTDTETFGGEANQDDLRVELAPGFAPVVLQEEIGANLRAVRLDLVLIKLNVGSRIGYGFRQGITNDLFVVDGDDDGPMVRLVEVDDYDTHGPLVGADAQLTVTRWLFGKAAFDVMAPLGDKERAGDGFADRLLWTLAATAGFRLPILAELLEVSLDYSLRLEKDGFLTDQLQFDQTIMARGRITLF